MWSQAQKAAEEQRAKALAEAQAEASRTVAKAEREAAFTVQQAQAKADQIARQQEVQAKQAEEAIDKVLANEPQASTPDALRAALSLLGKK